MQQETVQSPDSPQPDVGKTGKQRRHKEGGAIMNAIIASNTAKHVCLKKPGAVYMSNETGMKNGQPNLRKSDTPALFMPKFNHVVPSKDEQNAHTIRMTPIDMTQTSHAVRNNDPNMKQRVYPLGEFAQRRDFWYTQPARQTILAIYHDVKRDVDAMETERKRKREANGHEPLSDSSMSNTTKTGSATNPYKKQKTGNIKLPFGDLNTEYGYRSRGSKQQPAEVVRAYRHDRDNRFDDFFDSDSEDDETPFEMAPSDYRMFRDLQNNYKEKYENRTAYFQSASANVPRVDLPVIRRDYIRAFRYRPRGPEHGERLCRMGKSCRFYLLAKEQPNFDRNGAGTSLGYVGREFLLPEQLAIYERTKTLPAQTGLCIDCMLYQWTWNVYSFKSMNSNQRIDRSQPDDSLRRRMPVNTFTVLCERGEYSRHVMLPNELLDGEPTGIVGFVPRYNAKYRCYKSIGHHTTGRSSSLSSASIGSRKQGYYLNEENMDF